MLLPVKQALIRSLTSFVHCYNVEVLHAGVAELVDAPDSKSGGAKAPCRFEPDLRYSRSSCKSDEKLRHSDTAPNFLPGPFTATVLQPVSAGLLRGRAPRCPACWGAHCRLELGPNRIDSEDFVLGTFALSILPAKLLDAAWSELAYIVGSRAEIRTCPGCGSYFSPE